MRRIRADVILGTLCVIGAVVLTLAILTWFIVPDDGLEGLMALPLSAALVAITAFARATGSAHGALHRTRGVVAGATCAWLVVGGLMGLTGDPADFFSAAVSFACLGGGFVAVGGGVGFVLRAGARLMLAITARQVRVLADVTSYAAAPAVDRTTASAPGAARDHQLGVAVGGASRQGEWPRRTDRPSAGAQPTITTVSSAWDSA